MSRIVFWDTSAFLALANRRDALHSQAVAVSQALARENEVFEAFTADHHFEQAGFARLLR